jgi:hypothetical protein
MGAVGKAFDPWLPSLFVEATYEFSFVERLKLDDPKIHRDLVRYNNNHTDITGRIGYYILPQLEVDADINIRIANGGFDFVDWTKVSQAVRDYHDAVLAEGVVLIGGGGSYEIFEGLVVNAFFRIFVTGTNTRNTSMVGTGLTWAVF